jgi:type IV fimbrial biogenesis protein FimT
MDDHGGLLGHEEGRELLTMRRAARSAAHRGFSLIELMITVAIFTLLTLMALPMYSTWIASQQVRSAAESLLAGLHVAQGEAVKRNQPVSFVVDPAKGWQAKLVSDGSVVREAMLIEGSPKVSMTVSPSGTTTVIFDGLGRVLDNAQAPLANRITIDLDSTTGFSGVRVQRVVIDTAAATGVGIRSCDPKLADTDPRGCPS